ncbi:hypothetical protein Tsubulata_022617 [Turnera subulata]|uniref:Small ribosomal subunit protein uS10 domain-containing protein n=1 Tax=Turnera subulata TaxID=218843 RepID=A0A9Q0FBW2_9ROSI|nr:hypothetical protein Tsubulata_022617 [Turnera subulata]
MALISSSITTTTLFPPLTISASHSLPSKSRATTAKLCSFTLPSHSLYNPSKTLKPSSVSPGRVFAAPEVLDSVEGEDPSLDSEETQDPPLDETDSETFEDESCEKARPPSLAANADMMGAKQKIRIKLRSHWVPLIEDSCKKIMDAARTTNAKTMGPVPLPTKTRKNVVKSPNGQKDDNLHLQSRTHQRVIDILHPTAQTIDSLMQLDLPADVDVEVKF